MTLTSTIRRREKRKRAKARAADALARWNALSPERREMIEASRRMMAGIALPLLRNQLAFTRLVSREYK